MVKRKAWADMKGRDFGGEGSMSLRVVLLANQVR